MDHDEGPPVALSDHLRPTRDDYPPGVYRVVGAGEPVALLRVTDEGGRRRATGELLSVPRTELSGFESAADPDAGFHPLRWGRGLLSGIYWELRSLLP